MQGTGDGGVLALVLYTGRDSKLVLNQGKYKYKTSNTEVNLNWIFFGQMVQIFFFSSLFALLQSLFMLNHRNHEYLYEGIESDSLYSFGIFFSFWFILMRYIPFDVILQTETGKIIYSKIMEWDLQMMHQDAETKQLIACQVQSMQLPESLGEVDHIFCDKTGTLTQNDLDVKSISVNGKVCSGETREQICTQMETKCETKATENLLQCFCLCNEVRVSYDSK